MIDKTSIEWEAIQRKLKQQRVIRKEKQLREHSIMPRKVINRLLFQILNLKIIIDFDRN